LLALTAPVSAKKSIVNQIAYAGPEFEPGSHVRESGALHTSHMPIYLLT